MKVWFNGKHVDMNIGQAVTVFRCGSGHTVFGESAMLKRTTKHHLVFVTDSGAIVKTKIDNLHATVGRAQDNGYCVTPKPIDAFQDFIREAVRYWDKQTCSFVTR